MWCDLSKEWQRAFEEAWISFKGGSIPIGAIITDNDGNVLMTGRNESGEGRYPNHRVAHAEASCVRMLDIEKYPNLSEYHLYTKGASDIFMYASTQKVLSIITAMDYIDDLDEVDGIGEVRAQNINQSLRKMKEQYLYIR